MTRPLLSRRRVEAKTPLEEEIRTESGEASEGNAGGKVENRGDTETSNLEAEETKETKETEETGEHIGLEEEKEEMDSDPTLVEQNDVGGDSGEKSKIMKMEHSKMKNLIEDVGISAVNRINEENYIEEVDVVDLLKPKMEEGIDLDIPENFFPQFSSCPKMCGKTYGRIPSRKPPFAVLPPSVRTSSPPPARALSRSPRTPEPRGAETFEWRSEHQDHQNLQDSEVTGAVQPQKVSDPSFELLDLTLPTRKRRLDSLREKCKVTEEEDQGQGEKISPGDSTKPKSAKTNQKKLMQKEKVQNYQSKRRQVKKNISDKDAKKVRLGFRDRRVEARESISSEWNIPEVPVKRGRRAKSSDEMEVEVQKNIPQVTGNTQAKEGMEENDKLKLELSELSNNTEADSLKMEIENYNDGFDLQGDNSSVLDPFDVSLENLIEC